MNQVEEKMIIIGIVKSERYFTTVFPFLEEEYFEKHHTRIVFKLFREHYRKYNHRPNFELIEVFTETSKGLSEETYKDLHALLKDVKEAENINEQWLIDETESWIKSRRYFNAIFRAAEEYEKGQIDPSVPKVIEDALSFCFDSSVGMDFSDIEKRWEIYSSEDEKIPFKLNFLNVATNGGVSRKTLNMLMSGKSGGGKSLIMCDFAADYIKQGYNVVYFTFEMSEDKIFERIDANLLSVPIQDLRKLGREEFLSRMGKIKEKIRGHMIVKQYPTATCNVGHMRYFLNDLKMKRGIVPDVLIFDYLNIIASQRAKEGNSYTLVKATAEELRGLVVEQNCIGWTATQSNRSGITAEEDLSTDNVSDSVGTLFTADLLVGIITTDELDAENKVLLKILKNRYGDVSKNTKAFVGIRREMMRLEELEDVPFSHVEQDKIDDAPDFRTRTTSHRKFGGFS